MSSGDAYQTIAQTLGVSRADVEMMDSRLVRVPTCRSTRSSSTTKSSGSAQRMDFLVDDAPLPDEVVEQTLDSDRRARWLRDALAILSERELRIVQERRLTDNLVTLETLGDKLGISKERVRQIESRALTKLRKALSRLKDDEAAG